MTFRWALYSVFAVIVSVALVWADAYDGPGDEGYKLNWKDCLDEVDDVLLKFDNPLPAWFRGTYYLTGPGQWTLPTKKGSINFTHILDGFSKVYSWKFTDNGVLFTSHFLESGFRKQALVNGTIQWSVLAQDTVPPRPKPLNPLKAFNDATNDNNNVNPYMFDGELEILTDQTTMVGINPKTLHGGVLHKNFTDQDLPPGEFVAGGSAHPHPMKDGSFLGLRQSIHLTGPLQKERMTLYKIHPDKKNDFDNVLHIDVPRASYTHSFGITGDGGSSDWAVIPAQPIYFKPIGMMEHATLKDGFGFPDENTVLHVCKLDGSKSCVSIVDTVRPKFYFGHVINTFKNDDGTITLDIDTQTTSFVFRYSLDTMSNKTARDNWARDHDDGYNTPWRMVIDPVKKEVVSSNHLFAQEGAANEIDLFHMHPADYGVKYCGFWATQQYFNSTSFGAMAVVRVDLCATGGPKVVASWAEDSVYISEPVFTPDPSASSNDKTAGVVMFKALHGKTGATEIIIADAHTLKTVGRATLPHPIPFVIHSIFVNSNSNSS